MRKYIIGFIIGLVIGGGSVWASNMYIVLQDSSGHNVGTVSNPLYVTTS